MLRCGPGNSMSDKEILAAANELARKFYRLMGYEVRKGYAFHKATHPHEVTCWRMSVVAFEQIQGTDIDDVLNNLEDED